MTSPLMKFGQPRIVIALTVVLAVAVGGLALWRTNTFYVLSHHMAGGGHMHGADGTGHDEVNMPGLQGRNATQEESNELAVMFRNFETITREVTDLPNGITTVTRSSDPEVMDQLVSHVIGMIARVENKDDPEILIQSGTLDIFFARGDEIDTDIAVTEDGIVVTQTALDPILVAALHEHAAEVTAMSDRGMAAVHEMMMQ